MTIDIPVLIKDVGHDLKDVISSAEQNVYEEGQWTCDEIGK